MRSFIFLLLQVILVPLCAQDAYHSELISKIAEEYGIENPGFVLFDNELDNANSMYIYGSVTAQDDPVTDFDFTIRRSYDVFGVGTNVWDSGSGTANKSSINKDDIIVLSFWARKTSDNSEVFIFLEDGSTFEKEFYQSISFSPDWNQYFIAVQSTKDYSPGAMALGFQLAAQIQSFELGGYTALNYGQINLDDAPSSFKLGQYEGIEDDAPWRASAADRIENLRKANLTVNVKDIEGNPVEGANIRIEMQKHQFGFGTAIVACRTPGNDCYNETYINKLLDLDGEGHSFNVGVTENALKWDGWEEEWIGSPDETASAIQWLAESGIEMRGHTLFWPGFQNLPDDIEANKHDLNYLRNRFSSRIDEMINHPVLSNYIDEWDVLNEITQNRDLENAFKSDPNFVTGREIYSEIIEGVKTQDPNVKLYVNDYIVLSGGGSSSAVVNRYKTYLDEIIESGNEFDGIGFQCHIGSIPTSIPKIEATFDDFYDRYGKRMKVTEYDISEIVDPDIQAKYMEDILTITFSHPGLDAFIIWGFWDGNHWKNNAPIFKLNWELKPGGQAFIDKVFKDWWTEESKETESEGISTFRGFKGDYTIIISKGEAIQEFDLVLDDDKDIAFTFDITNSLDDIIDDEIKIFPTIVSNGSFTIAFPEERKIDFLEILDADGKRMNSISNVSNYSEIKAPAASGLYFIKLYGELGIVSKKIIVK